MMIEKSVYKTQPECFPGSLKRALEVTTLCYPTTGFIRQPHRHMDPAYRVKGHAFPTCHVGMSRWPVRVRGICSMGQRCPSAQVHSEAGKRRHKPPVPGPINLPLPTSHAWIELVMGHELDVDLRFDTLTSMPS